MIVYQRSHRLYLVRALLLLLQPGMFILTDGIVLLVYLALRGAYEQKIVIAMWLGVAVLVIIFMLSVYTLIKSAVTEIVKMEIVPSGFSVQQLRYDILEDTVIPLQELGIEIFSHEHRSKNKQTHISYSLRIYIGSSEKAAFAIGGSVQELGEILEKIEDQKLIPLKENELAFLAQYKRFKGSLIRPLSNALRKLTIAATVIMIVVVGYDTLFGGLKIIERFGGFSMEAASEQSEQTVVAPVNWRAAEFFLNFPKKLYPVFTLGEGLERHQVCGVEEYVVMEEVDGKWFWRQHNYRDTWEAEITMANQEYGDYLRLYLQLPNGEAREYPFGKDQTFENVYLLKTSQQLYTSMPEKYVVYNADDECK